MKQQKKHTIETIRQHKLSRRQRPLKMLTCYDYQNARLLNETSLDMILVGDSLGNVVLGHPHTISVTPQEMIIFGAAVKRGATDKFTVCDMPFGSYRDVRQGLKNAAKLFQKTGVEALKLEGAASHHLKLMEALRDNGIPAMGHIGVTPQSVHLQGGYGLRGKDKTAAARLTDEACRLEEAGAFALVLECIVPEVATNITSAVEIPTIGIGSGEKTDGQVLVLNDLFNMGGGKLPKFVNPVANFFRLKKDLLEIWLNPEGQRAQLEEHADAYH